MDVTIFYTNIQLQAGLRIGNARQRAADLFYRYTHHTMVPRVIAPLREPLLEG
ncbi:Uncharacterised protein [Bordetella pertussis]|nr:hypothetical protein DK45_4545 [Bordetella bronchiseptica]CFO08477.1 Uncharacterised protein [Bordetella pertussis]CFO74832.1 Uncharacterised protein [Bordetella pertussis]CFP64584.1 Uncharacterised protein [Bordetella pertussis]CFU84647.1 Uncharacterised protein [Bordetella pertussis]